MSLHCLVTAAIMGGMALLLGRRGLFCPVRTGFWVWLSLSLTLVVNPAITLISGDYTLYAGYTLGIEVTAARVNWVLLNIAVGMAAFFVTYLSVKPASLPRVEAQIPGSLALVCCAPFLLLGFATIFFNVTHADPGQDVVNGKYVGSVSGWQTGCATFAVYPCLLLMCIRRVRVVGMALAALYLAVRVKSDIGARYSVLALPLAMVFYVTIRRGRRWPSIWAAGPIAALLLLLVARGHNTLQEMNPEDRTAWSVVSSAAKKMAQGPDTSMLPTFYLESELVDRVGFSYGLTVIQQAIFGPLPRKYFPWKTDVFASVPGVRLIVDLPETIHWSKPSIICAFYGYFGIAGVALGMALLALLLRKLDGFLEAQAPVHLLLWAAMVLAGVWVGVLGGVEWWYQDAMICSCPFLTLLALSAMREHFAALPS